MAGRSRPAYGTTSVAALRCGVVTPGRADVDVVVTEYGVAHLRGATAGQAARRLVAIAAPEAREDLARSVTG